MDNTFDEIKTEVVKITVQVEITYKKDDKKSRKYALKTAKENCIGIKTYGYPVSTKPLTVKVDKGCWKVNKISAEEIQGILDIINYIISKRKNDDATNLSYMELLNLKNKL